MQLDLNYIHSKLQRDTFVRWFYVLGNDIWKKPSGKN